MRWLAALLAWGVIWIARLRRRQVGLIVVYHGVTSSLAPTEIAPVVERKQLAKDLARFRRQYRPVALERLHEAILARDRGGRIPIALTFDDDLHSHASVALPLLEHAGVQATFFVSGDEQACRRAYWWEPLTMVLDRGMPLPAGSALSQAGRDPARLAAAMLELTQDEREAMTEALWQELSPAGPPAHLSIAGVAELAARGHEIGFHTRHHPVLTELSPQELVDALTVGVQSLEEAVGTEVRSFAYPYGITDERVTAAAASAGFARCVTTEPRAVTPTTDPLRLGRIDAAAGSSQLLALRLARALRRQPAP